MTVSRVFKRDASVTQATRDRILKIADEIGYIFDSTAALEFELVSADAPPITMREGARRMAELWERVPDIDAVACVSDLSAFGALTECQRRGLRVPEDL